MIILSLHEKNSHDFPWREFVQRDVTGVYQEFAKETNNARGESEQIREANRVESSRVESKREDRKNFKTARGDRWMINMQPTMPVQILQEGVASFAVEGAVGPTDFEQGTDGPSRAGPAVGAGAGHRRQR